MSVSSSIKNIVSSLPEGVKLVAVSKFRPLEQLREAFAAGQRDFAESRPREFAAKVAAMEEDARLRGEPSGIRWHFIGHLQTNKLKYVLPYVSMVHSIDTLHLLDAVQRFAAASSLTVDVLLELHIGAEQTKQGFTPQEALSLDLYSLAATHPNVRLRGLMGMASHTEDQVRIEEDFACIEQVFNQLRLRFPDLECFDQLSAGMSDDWRIALRHGTTMVRIGSAIFL